MTTPSPIDQPSHSAGDTESGPSFAAKSALRRARRYGFACASCKTRKVRCNGDHPICSSCRRSGNQCVWPDETTAEGQLREANARIRWLEASARQGDNSNAEQHENNARQDSSTFAGASDQRLNGSSTSPDGANTETTPATINTDGHTDSGTQIWFQVGLGEDGAVVYNGPTSRFHAGAVQEDRLEEIVGSTRNQVETLGSQYSLMDTVWTPLAAAKSSMNGIGVSTDVGMALLDIYWTWLHPLHNCVYRPAFVMDLALGGPYCSDFLLTCIFGLAARHLPEKHPVFSGNGKGDRFVAKAKELLLEEMTAPKPAIPTIQGLLILGGRQCAAGHSSEGWLYTGMALRMMKDIGLHLDIKRLAVLEKWTPAETETRKRLYNSAYIWDKTLSLALGRPPSLTRRPYNSSEILDKFDDERIWSPIHASEVVESFLPTPSWNTSTFCSFCELHEITTDMMLLFSNASLDENFGETIENLDARIDKWYEDSPPALRIDDPSTITQSPLPHIVSLNLLYHSLKILLRRPHLSSPDNTLRTAALKTCITHSKLIHEIHIIYTRTFPHRLMTYQVSYCIYTAATVEAQQLRSATEQAELEAAASRLSDALKVLQSEAAHNPGSGRSLDTIRRLLSAGGQPHLGQNQPRPRASTLALDVDGTLVLDWQTRQTGGAGGFSLPQGDAPHVAQQPTAAMHSGYVGQENPFVAMVNGAAWGDDYRFGGTDTGAGFQPDALPWAVGLGAPSTGSGWWQDARGWG